MPEKKQRLPLRQQLFIVMLFLFSFANVLPLMLFLGFPLDSITYFISVLLGIGLTFTVYKMLYKLGEVVYAGGFMGDKQPPEGE
jgi:hypothetical protein